MNKQESQKRERERTPNNRTTTGFRISDELWAVLQPLLPVHVNRHRFGGGRPRVPDRDCADAIFYVADRVARLVAFFLRANPWEGLLFYSYLLHRLLSSPL